MTKHLKLFSLSLVIGALFVAVSPTEVLAFDSGNIIFNEVNRYEEIFDFYRQDFATKNDIKTINVKFDCDKLSAEIETIDDEIDDLKDRLADETDAEKIEKYKSNKRSYNKALLTYRSYEGSCTDDNGAIPPTIGSIYSYKRGDYDDLRIEIEDREKSPARLRYYLSENGDVSVSASIVITGENITYPYELKDYEVYNVSFKPEEERFYLKGNLASYKDAYIYIIPSFATTDSYFTTRPFSIVTESKNETDMLKLVDLKNGMPYYDSIKGALEKKIIQGFSDNTFRANDMVTRKEFLKIALLAGKKTLSTEKSDLPFSDIDKGDWSFSYLKTALKENIIEGKNKEYYPNRGVNYLEAMKMISKALNIEIIYDTTSVDSLPSDHWGVPFVNYYQKKGIISSNVKDYERPLKRGEAIDLVIKALELK